jgi:hypothetical protein
MADTETGSQATTGIESAAQRAWSSRGQRWILIATLGLGVIAAVGLGISGSPTDQTFRGVSGPVQSLISVLAPLVGVMLAKDLRADPHRPLGATLMAAAVVGAVMGAVGAVVCALTTLAADPPDAWAHAGLIALGSVVVQVAAVLVGTGFGLLIRRPVLAFLATIVLPLGLWLILGQVSALKPAQAWLAPYPSAQRWLAGDLPGLAWLQWLVVVLIWAVGLNLAGAVRLARFRR